MLNPRENTSRLQQHARGMRKEPSEAERRLWNKLRSRKLDGLKFRRQLPIGVYIADFACEEVRLIVEVDGKQHEFNAQYDECRTRVLSDAGWRVIRVYSGDVLRDVKAVLRFILSDARKPSP